MKKLLTINDLYNFCLSNNFSHFSSKNNGEVIVIHSDGLFETQYDSTQGLMPVRLQACHTELNRNKSYIKESVMLEALPSFKNRPILGNIIELDNGEFDFHSHDMKIDSERNEITYIERPIGIIPESCNARLEYDKDKEKDYVVIDGLIFEDYGNKAAEIIKSKKSVKVSVELCIEEMSFNAKEKYLSIDKFYFNGVTCLGREEDGTEIGEGMLGSNLVSIEDFCSSENSVNKEDAEKELFAIISECKDALNNFNNKLKNVEGGNQMKKDIKGTEAFDDANIDAPDVEAGSEGGETPVLEADMEQATDVELNSDETEGVDEAKDDEEKDEEAITTENAEADEVIATENEAESDVESDVIPEVLEKKKRCEVDEFGNMTVSYEVSHDDIRCGIYALLELIEEENDTYYYISEVFDTYFLYSSWSSNNDRIFKQAYKVEEDVVAFVGDRIELFVEYLTAEEKVRLELIRGNYDELVAFKESIEASNLLAEKEAILNTDEYSVIADTAEFKELVKNIDNYSVEQLDDQATLILGKYAKSNKSLFNFEKETTLKKQNFVALRDKSNSTPEKNPFLDGLLNLK